jgi:hypothetical protein
MESGVFPLFVKILDAGWRREIPIHTKYAIEIAKFFEAFLGNVYGELSKFSRLEIGVVSYWVFHSGSFQK